MINHVLGEKDASGRRRPVDVDATEFTLRVDTVISALGQEVDIADDAGVHLSKWNTIDAEEATGATSVKGVFAGGDCVTGPDNLISAIAAGKRAAVAIDHFIAGDEASLVTNPEPVAVEKDIVLRRSGDKTRQARIPLQVVAPEERKKTLDEPTTATMTEAEAVAEAARCLSCGCGEACGQCYRVCMSLAIGLKGTDYEIDEEKCHACGMCFRRCPNLNIEMVRTDDD